MKHKIKSILIGLSALAMFSTAPSINAYNISEPKIIVKSDSIDLHVNFSKDGKKFVYSRMQKKDYNHVITETVVNENGIEKVIVKDEYMDVKPAFSPDGKKIAFFRNLGMGCGSIYIVGSDGKNLEELIPATITRLSWSPDGKEIAFTCMGEEDKTKVLTAKEAEAIKKQEPNKNYKAGDELKYKTLYYAIGVVNVNTKEVRTLAKSEGKAESPEFTDDGRILYLYNKNGGYGGQELWIMDRDGNNKKQIIQLENSTTRTINADKSVTLVFKEGTIDHFSADGDSIAYSAGSRERILHVIPKKNNQLAYDAKELKDEYVSALYVKNLKTGETKLVTDEGNVWFPELKNNKVYFSRCVSLETDHDIYSIDLK